MSLEPHREDRLDLWPQCIQSTACLNKVSSQGIQTRPKVLKHPNEEDTIQKYTAHRKTGKCHHPAGERQPPVKHLWGISIWTVH